MSYEDIIDSEQTFRTGFLEWNVTSDVRLEANHPLYCDSDGPICCVITKVSDQEFHLSGEFAPAVNRTKDLKHAFAAFENELRDLIIDAVTNPLHECHQAAKRLLNPEWKKSESIGIAEPPTVDVTFKVVGTNNNPGLEFSPLASFEPVNDCARVMQMTPECSQKQITIVPSGIRIGTYLTIRMQG